MYCHMRTSTLTPILMILSFCKISLAQTEHTLIHQGITRSYILSYPENIEDSCPLIINMHGFGGNGSNQSNYSLMDEYALPQGVAVAYPDGLISSWNVGTFWDSNPFDDIDFISSLIDTIATDYNIDLDRVYATGMSNGGYMAYELSCELSHKIAAFGSVTGNFMLNENQICNNQKETPIIHFHGTEDAVVDYYPPSFDGSLTPMEAMEFWKDINKFDLTQVDTLSGNTNELSAHKYEYFRLGSHVKLVHYMIIGGGHDWFGSPYVSPSVVNASEILVEFFLEYNLQDLPCLEPNGDINEDGYVDMSDYIFFISYIITGSNSINTCMDMNHDSNFNIIDILMVIDSIL